MLLKNASKKQNRIEGLWHDGTEIISIQSECEDYGALYVAAPDCRFSIVGNGLEQYVPCGDSVVPPLPNVAYGPPSEDARQGPPGSSLLISQLNCFVPVNGKRK